LNLDLSNNEEILKFVGRFGLLGLLQHKYYERRIAIINGQEQYFVPERKGDFLLPVYEIAQNYLLDIKEFKKTGSFLMRKTMSEPLDEFIHAVEEFQDTGKFAYAIKKAEHEKSFQLRKLFLQTPDLAEFANREKEEILRIAKSYVHIALLDGANSINRIVLPVGGEKWQTKWSFESLLGAAYFFLTQDLCGSYRLDECPRCGKLFLSSVSKRQFCSRKCEDATRKAESRRKAKEVKQNGKR